MKFSNMLQVQNMFKVQISYHSYDKWNRWALNFVYMSMFDPIKMLLIFSYGTSELPYSIQIHLRYVDMLLYYVNMLLRYVRMLLYHVHMLLY